jgi:hypothetical protein
MASPWDQLLMADLLKRAMSNLVPMVEEKLDFFFWWEVMKDFISKVLLMQLELLVSSFDFWLFRCLDAAELERFLRVWVM